MIDLRHIVCSAGLGLYLLTPASAQDAIRCANFLHNRDGTWRSFYQADLYGPNGVVHIDEGEQLSPSARSAKGDVARALNGLCEGQ